MPRRRGAAMRGREEEAITMGVVIFFVVVLAFAVVVTYWDTILLFLSFAALGALFLVALVLLMKWWARW